MTTEDFISEWGHEPDSSNYIVNVEQDSESCGTNVYLYIAQPRRNNIEEIVIKDARLTDVLIDNWIRKSLLIYLQQVGLSRHIQAPSEWSLPL